MALATLSIDLVAQLAKLTEGLDKATRLNEKAAADIERRWKAMSSVATSIGATIGASLSAGWAVSFVRGTVDAIDALNDVKDATGASIENISALERVARENGGTLDQVSQALVKMNQALKDTKAGDDTDRILTSIGLSAKELRAQDPADALLQIAKAFNQYEDDGNKARSMQEILGKSLKDLAPFMKDMAERGELVATVTAKQAEEAEAFNKSLFRLRSNVEDVTRSFVSGIIPALNDYIEKLNRASKFGLSGFFTEREAKNASRELSVITNAIIDVTERLKSDPNNDGLKKSLANLRAEFEATSKKASEASDRLKGFAEASKPVKQEAQQSPQIKFPEIPDAPKKSNRDAISEYEKLKQRILEKLKAEQQEAALGRDLSSAERERLTLLGAVEGAQKKLTDTEERDLKRRIESLFVAQQENDARKRSAAVAKEVQDARAKALSSWVAERDAMRENNEALRQQLEEIGLNESAIRRIVVARMDNVIAMERERLAEMQRETRGAGGLEALREKIDLLQQQRDLVAAIGAAQDTQANDPFEGIKSAMRDYMDEVKRMGDQTRTAVSSALQTTEQALTDFFMTGKFGWSSYISAILQQIVRLAIVQPMVNSLVGALSYGGGGFVANGSTSAGGSLGALGLSGGRAAGGPVDGGRAYIVGENGPELFVPRQSGNVLSNGKLKTRGSSPTVVQNISIAADMDEATWMRRAAQLKAETKNELRRNMRRGEL